MSKNETRPGLVFESSSPNPMMPQRVKLEMSFGQVFGLCFKVILAQMLLVPIIAVGGAVAVLIASWLLGLFA